MTCRQGKQFVGLAQSLGPHLGYLIGPALDALSAQIQTVAASNAQQQHLRRRSISCSLPPVETLTLHDSAGSLSTPSGQPAAPQQQTSSRQTQPPLPGQPPRQRSANALPPQQPQAGSRMLSPFQTYTAAAAASQQPSSPEGAPGEQSEAAPDQPGSDRLDLSPAKTALDMSMLEIARLHAGSPAPVQPPLIHEAVRRVSSGHLARHSAKSGEVSPGADAAVHGREMDLEYQPSIEAPPRGSSSFDMGRGKGKGYRRPPMPMLRASSPLSAYGSEPSSHLPTQLSIPGLSGSGRYSQQAEQQGAPDAGSPMALPFAARPSGRTPFACVPPSHPTQAGQTSSCMQAPGSIISLSQVLPGMLHTSQAPSAGPWQQQQPQQQSQLSPSAVASLAASLPPQLSNSAMAVLSAPMSSSMPPSPYSRSLAALSMPSLLPRSGSGMLGRPPQQQSRGILPPTAYQEAQPQQPHLDQLGYRLPTQLQSASLLLQLLPAGSAQSLTQLMSRAASGAPVEFDPQEPAAMARSSSLSNDNSTSVSVGSPKRSLLDMSRAVSEQLHLTSAGKGVQRPFLADLQQRWTAGHQVSCSHICYKHTSAPVILSLSVMQQNFLSLPAVQRDQQSGAVIVYLDCESSCVCGVRGGGGGGEGEGVSRGIWVSMNFSVSPVRAHGAELGYVLLCFIKLSTLYMRICMLCVGSMQHSAIHWNRAWLTLDAEQRCNYAKTVHAPGICVVLTGIWGSQISR